MLIWIALVQCSKYVCAHLRLCNEREARQLCHLYRQQHNKYYQSQNPLLLIGQSSALSDVHSSPRAQAVMSVCLEWAEDNRDMAGTQLPDK